MKARRHSSQRSARWKHRPIPCIAPPTPRSRSVPSETTPAIPAQDQAGFRPPPPMQPMPRTTPPRQARAAKVHSKVMSQPMTSWEKPCRQSILKAASNPQSLTVVPPPQPTGTFPRISPKIQQKVFPVASGHLYHFVPFCSISIPFSPPRFTSAAPHPRTPAALASSRPAC